jgi:hypothetical protein
MLISDMRKLSAKWASKCLNADQKRGLALASQAILDQFRQDPMGFLNNARHGDILVPVFKEVQDTEAIKQGVGICLLGQ